MGTVAQEVTAEVQISQMESTHTVTVKPMEQKREAIIQADEYVLRAAFELHMAKSILSNAPRCGAEAKKVSNMFEAVDKYIHKADKKIQLAKEESNG